MAADGSSGSQLGDFEGASGGASAAFDAVGVQEAFGGIAAFVGLELHGAYG